MTGPPRAYCTYFDSHYLARGLAMLRSLRRCDPAASIHVLALDPTCGRVLRDVLGDRVSVVDAVTLYEHDPVLAVSEHDRGRWPFYATHKPVLARYVLEHDAALDTLAFIDADTWFYADPAPVFAEIGSASIALSPHRFHADTAGLARFGTYSAGFICWRNDAVARRCLADWRAQCLDWCREEALPDGRFMNQGYLNTWPRDYERVHVIAHPGANLGPWNVDGHTLTLEASAVRVDGQPLVFYHFSGMLRGPDGAWRARDPYVRRDFDAALKAIYQPYFAAVEAERAMLLAAYGVAGTETVRPERVPSDPRRLNA